MATAIYSCYPGAVENAYSADSSFIQHYRKRSFGANTATAHHQQQQQEKEKEHGHGSIHALSATSAHRSVPSPAQLSISPPVHSNGFLGGRSKRSHDGAHQHHQPIPAIHSLSVIDTFRKVLDGIDMDDCDAAGENAFLVCDIKRVWDRYQLWQRELGDRVEAFFAVKCNPDPVLIQLMARLGLGFDCASHQEISSVLAHGVDPDKIIYANPCKAASFIRHAAKQNVQMMTFDNADELVKIKKYHPTAKMVLRILTDDSGSLCKLGLKFGAPLGEVRPLLQKAKELGVDVIGISFHVGSGCTNPALFGDAVERARWAFDIGAELGFEFTLLDIGGGFGGDNFVQIASVVRPVIERLFPKDEGIRVIAEPGRYFVSEAFEMATNIIARRGKGTAIKDEEDDEELEELTACDPDEEEAIVMYYINDGVYGAFNCTMFDHQVVHPKVMTIDGQFVSQPALATDEAAYEPCSVWGPTCDSIDCVSKLSYLPTKQLRVGDWLRWESMGAYTICAASQFNGFKQAKVVYCIDADPYTEAQIRRLLN